MSFVASAFWLSRIHKPEPPPEPPAVQTGLWTDIASYGVLAFGSIMGGLAANGSGCAWASASARPAPSPSSCGSSPPGQHRIHDLPKHTDEPAMPRPEQAVLEQH